MRKLYIILFFFFVFLSFSQTKVKDTITRTAKIGYDKKGNLVTFKPETPPLIQVAGAPPASYSYFWEMGDGSFSKEKEPKKVYKKKGDYKVNLSVTNNYDNGKPPKTRPKLVAINEISDTNYEDIAALPDTTSIQLFKNREPIPEEEIVVVITYQNPLDYVANGKLYLFYNDKEFKNKNFELLETRTHFGEKEISENGVAYVEDFNNSNENVATTSDFPSFRNNFKVDDSNLDLTLLESNALFSDSKVLEFDNMNAKETRNVFMTFKTTPEMIKDTSATVKMRGIYVPDRNYKNHKKKTLEMEIVTSHDPNKMSSNATLMNYRTVRFKTINFKTRFQNNGEGPARMIRLETDIPEMFDKKTLKIVDSYPKCPICPKNEEIKISCLDTIIKEKQIHFTFKNVYVPGSNQKNVKEIDSTKGFVKYTMKFGKDFHKVKTKSQTAIIFDKNEPVITNYATTRFKPGISVGVRAGYNLYTDLNKNNVSQEISSSIKNESYFIGATISPYKSYRFYWQSELYFSKLTSSYSSNASPLEFKQFVPPIELTNGTIVDGGFETTSSNNALSRVTMDIVPISLRYNINNFIGVGVGPQFSVLLNQNNEVNTTRFVYQALFSATSEPTVGDEIVELRNNTSTSSKLNAFDKMQTSVFADATFGFARIGPSVGIRYYKTFERDYNYWQFYAIWKF
jgi:hypothetical protein